MYIVKEALLLIIFNRLDTTQSVFEVVASVRPRKLYVAGDGPRDSVAGEKEKVESVRAWVTSHVDWPCEVHTFFQSENLGCKMAVSSALSWFFARERRGIILEDDCLPSTSFFRFCDELLAHYQDDPAVMSISGYNCLKDNQMESESSYFFSKYFHCWGWASWRESWSSYDVNLSKWPGMDKKGFMKRIQPGRSFRRYFTPLLDGVARGGIDTWDYQMLFNIWENNGLCCTPGRNLVSNIGFRADATHTKDPSDSNANIQRQELDFPLTHPGQVARNMPMDALILKYGYKPGPLLFRKKGINNYISSLLRRFK